ncbi:MULTISPECIES: DUF6415 family natural product biosynthesis protein [Streptomyces violaceoruber group]|uniref:DUF6415 family natural product biosynthesis protein n=1 Tax=Streptomyces rubrogriseus TaxID=194673 RepID=A0ABT4NXM9_9ACTN|nr:MULTISPECIES: DUF6415 family natural product biosynthesis protein [Streptomyces anthocyanicus group]MCW8119226.1 DUF6415 family natural product biosynthesis protein [Streptomyces anthocyanicus]MCZ4632472.1 DUF6415 family natural product biosynthesis protein [Streptomyces rubrogriseus]
MTATTIRPGWSHPVRAAVPPFTDAGLRRVLEKVQRWAPHVDGLLLDDVAAVLDDYTPTEHEVDEHAQRLRGHLMRLVHLAVVSKVAEQDGQVADLINRGRTIGTEEVPTDHRRAVGHLRRMAWTLHELLERLVADQCLTEAP